jgi:hypothetical protein
MHKPGEPGHKPPAHLRQGPPAKPEGLSSGLGKPDAHALGGILEGAFLDE